MASTNNEMSKEDAAQPPRDESIETLRAAQGDGHSGLVGRELDAAVAERVMGYYRVPSLGNWAWKRKPEDLPYSVPHYSTSITAAMEVFEKMRQSGKWCCIKLESDYHYIWRVLLTRSESDANINPKHVPTVKEIDESLPVAICRAALAAVAHNEEANK